MKQLLTKLFAPTHKAKDTSNILAKAYEESHYTSLWQDTGEVMYLFDTIKLSFESEVGEVTFEKLKPEDVASILADIEQANSPAMRQKITAEQTAEIRISICRQGEVRRDGCAPGWPQLPRRDHPGRVQDRYHAC